MSKWTAMLAAAAIATPALAVDWDESIDGDLSDDESNPTALALDLGSNIVSGTIGGSSTDPTADFFDALTITVGAGQTLDAVNVLAYQVTGGNTSTGFNVAIGQSWDGDFGSANFLGSATITTAGVGTDLLDTPDLGGFLAPGDYVIALREGTPGQIYSLDFVLVPAPGAAAVLGLGVLAGVRRRR